MKGLQSFCHKLLDKMRRFLLLTIGLLLGLTRLSADELWVGYGNPESGMYGKTAFGTKSTTLYTAAIKIPASQVAAYVGGSINKIQFATAKKSPNLSWFVTDQLGDVSQEVAVEGGLNAGWHEFELEFPYLINEAKDIYIGFTSKGASNVIPIEKANGAEGSCILGEGASYADYYVEKGKDYSLNIRALVQVDGETVLSFSSSRNIVTDAYTPVLVTGKAMLLKDRPVTSYTFRLTLDGRVIDTPTFECDMQKRGDRATYQFTLPAMPFGSFDYSVELTAINGEALANPFCSSARLTSRDLFVRKHVVEECTGLWCGFCVRGIVGMREMREKYPDTFIGIAVHAATQSISTDIYDVMSTYLPLVQRIEGFPSGFVNRKVLIDPSAEEMEKTMQAQPAMAEEQVVIKEARFTDAKHSTLAIKTSSRFSYDHHQTDYRLAFVILEDHLPGVQTNYYAAELGYDYGPMGGFENERSHVQVDLMDVAREIQCYEGIEGSVPDEIRAGEVYDYTYEFKMPQCSDLKNVYVVALLQNADGTEILNADKCEHLLEFDAEVIEAVSADAPDEGASFDLQGRRLAAPQRGHVILHRGQKHIVR